MSNDFSGEFDPAEQIGFARVYLEVMQRFRSVAVDQHVDDGGSLEDVEHHITGVVDEETLLTQYDLPVIMTTPGAYDPNKSTTASDQGTLTMNVVVWVEDYDQLYGLELAVVLAGNVVNNVEQNRVLAAQDGSDVLAKDVSLESFTPDFTLNAQNQRHLKFCSVTFEISLKRNLARVN